MVAFFAKATMFFWCYNNCGSILNQLPKIGVKLPVSYVKTYRDFRFL